MKFAFVGDDFYSMVFSGLIEKGHELVGGWIPGRDNHYATNLKVKSLCEKYQVPVFSGKVRDSDLTTLNSEGLDLLVSGSHPFKIPTENLPRYHFNIHSSLLPTGRGSAPLPEAILREEACTGVTFHKISDGWDEGDILLQKEIPVLATDNHDTLSIKVLSAALHMIVPFLDDIESYWGKAQPQTEGSYWQRRSNDERKISWDMPTREIDRWIRAFGRFGMLADFAGKEISIFQATCWEEKHDLRPGTVLSCHLRDIAVACSDGFVCLHQFEVVS